MCFARMLNIPMMTENDMLPRLLRHDITLLPPLPYKSAMDLDYEMRYQVPEWVSKMLKEFDKKSDDE